MNCLPYIKAYWRNAAYLLLIVAFLLTPAAQARALSESGLSSLRSEHGLYDPKTQCSSGTTASSETPAAAPIQASSQQEANARAIIGIAKSLNLGEKGALVGLMTGLQESSLRNTANPTVPLSKQSPDWLKLPEPRPLDSNKDSLGIMQQRISMGWSTFGNDVTQDSANQLMNPLYAAQAFFGTAPGATLPADLKQPSALKRGLQNVKGWEDMDPARAAQEVQRSGVPDGYVKRRGEAQKLMDQYYASSPALPLPISVTGGSGPAATSNTAAASGGGNCVCSGGAGAGTAGVVVIDPGHSGTSIKRKDPETLLKDLDYANIPEIDDVWTVATQVRDQLTPLGYTVLFSKDAGPDKDHPGRGSAYFRDRVNVAVKNHAVLAVSIHTDGSQPFSNRNNYVYPQVVGRYRTNTENQNKTFDNQATADKSKAYSDAIVTARTNAEGHSVTRRDDAGPDIGGRSDWRYDSNDISPGNIWMVQLFSKDIPWVYNEAGGYSAGQKGLSKEDITKYATGIANGIKAAVAPGNGGAAAPAASGNTPAPASTSSSGCNSGSVGTGVEAIKNTIFKYSWPDYCRRYSDSCKGYASPETEKPEYKAASEAAQKKGDYVGSCNGVDCGGFVTRVMRDSGADPDYNRYPQGNTVQQMDYLVRNSGEGKKYIRVTDLNALQGGDIAIKSHGTEGHTFFYVGKMTGPNGEAFNGDAASADQCKRAPMAGPTDTRSDYVWFRLVNPSAPTVRGDGKNNKPQVDT